MWYTQRRCVTVHGAVSRIHNRLMVKMKKKIVTHSIIRCAKTEIIWIGERVVWLYLCVNRWLSNTHLANFHLNKHNSMPEYSVVILVCIIDRSMRKLKGNRRHFFHCDSFDVANRLRKLYYFQIETTKSITANVWICDADIMFAFKFKIASGLRNKVQAYHLREHL